VFLRQRQLDDLIEAIDHNSTVLADLIDVLNTRAGALDAMQWSVPQRHTVGGWLPVEPRDTGLQGMSPEDVTAARQEALGIVDEVHRAQDRTDDAPLLDGDTPVTEKEACP
jgi:hypothetical protein